MLLWMNKLNLVNLWFIFKWDILCSRQYIFDLLYLYIFIYLKVCMSEENSPQGSQTVSVSWRGDYHSLQHAHLESMVIYSFWSVLVSTGAPAKPGHQMNDFGTPPHTGRCRVTVLRIQYLLNFTISYSVANKTQMIEVFIWGMSAAGSFFMIDSWRERVPPSPAGICGSPVFGQAGLIHSKKSP